MKLATTAMLATPSAGADRSRSLLVVTSTALAGALLIAAARIARWGIDRSSDVPDVATGDRFGGLAPYLTDSGLRPGVVLGAVLLTVPVLALAVQALRVGSLARERRMSSLRLAGATPGDARRVAAAEAGGGAFVGGLLAGPAYVVLWVLLGVLPSSGLRMMPTPSGLDLLAWLVVAVVAALAGGIAGAVVQGRVITDPLGVRRRGSVSRAGRGNLVTLVSGLLLIGLGVYAFRNPSNAGFAAIVVLIAGLLLLAFSVAPRLVRLRGQRLARRGPARDLLAGARLAADPVAAGRVAAVLMICGLALGIEASMVAGLLGENRSADDLSFYLTGFAMAALGVLVAVVVTILTLLVGAADQLLDARRPLASLGALGVDATTLERVLRRQQSATAVPAAVLGALIGGAFGLFLEGNMGVALTAALLAAAALGLAVALITRLAARLLRTKLLEALDPENLRVA